ncbi:unnamed protein product [Adineta ricciae]|uniref:Uncharacterized protein n=1 Tax=Adineta ricciae TaxID=249248 RepID=A0A814UPV2_ADIRI|nr:unnamed protein product [Adineta ricciae]
MNVYGVNTCVLLFVSVHSFVRITSEQIELNRVFNLSPDMRIFSLTNTSTTTCTTVPKTKTTASTPTTNHSLGYLGRRLLNEPSYDTDLDTSSQHQHLLQADNEINEFLQVNEEDMFKALENVELTTDGSGETSYSTAEYSSEVTSTLAIGSVTTDTSAAAVEGTTSTPSPSTMGVVTTDISATTAEEATSTPSPSTMGVVTTDISATTAEEVTSTPSPSTMGVVTTDISATTAEEATSTPSPSTMGVVTTDISATTAEEVTSTPSPSTMGVVTTDISATTAEEATSTPSPSTMGVVTTDISATTAEEATSTPSPSTMGVVTTDTSAAAVEGATSTPSAIEVITTEKSTTVEGTTSTPATTGVVITETSATAVQETTGASLISEPVTTETDHSITSAITSQTLLSTTTTTPMTTTIPDETDLPNVTTILLILNCSNANETLADIIAGVSKSNSLYEIEPIYNQPLSCATPGKVNVTLVVRTPNNNVTLLNDLYEIIDNLTRGRDVTVFSKNPCGRDDEMVLVMNTTSCFLIDTCSLCGVNPVRGVCNPSQNIEKCRCYVNEADPSSPYEGNLCSKPRPKPVASTYSLSRWTPIIIGVLAGLTGLFAAVTCCLWAMAAWRRRRHHHPEEFQIRRIWHLPRAKVPTPVTADNAPTNLEPTNSTASTHPPESEPTDSNTTDSTFFKDLDQRMGEKLRATITRPNTNAVLASLPSDTASTLSSYDPIDELDAIIDNEDINPTFHDPLDELYDDNEMLEVMNPNLKLPRPNVDSKPTGLFSLLK